MLNGTRQPWTGPVERERRRRRWTRRGVAAAIIAVLFAIGAAFWVKRRHRERPLRISENVPAGVNQQLSGYTFTRFEGGRPIFTVHAARTRAYKNGSTTVLEDVTVELFGHAGNRHDLLRTDSCDYSQASGGLSCAGKVEVELNALANDGKESPAARSGKPSSFPNTAREPIYLETSNVSFEPQGALVTDRPVDWRFGLASGHATGLVYATRDNWLELKSNVVASLPASDGAEGDASARAPLRLTAGGLRYTKASGEIDLRAPVEIAEGARRVTSKSAAIALDTKNQVRSAVLAGGVRAWDSDGTKSLEASAASLRADFEYATRDLRRIIANGAVRIDSRGAGGGVSHLAAQEVSLNFSGPHLNPTGGVAKGAVELSSEPGAGSSSGVVPATLRSAVPGASRPGLHRESLAASEIDFKFRPRTSRLAEAQTQGPGKLLLEPADTAQGDRTITAGQFHMAFDTLGRLASVQGFSPTGMTVEPAKSRPDRAALETTAERLQATLDPASGAVVALIQSGKFHFQDGERQATSERAEYSARDQTLVLTGKPMVWEPDGRVRADLVRLNLASDIAEGIGHVQSSQSGGTATFEPASGAGEITNVVADRVVVNRRTAVARYAGHVRAWRGYEVIEAPLLDLYWKERRIIAQPGVTTSDLQPSSLNLKPAAKAGSSAQHGAPGATRAVTIRADRLEYSDSKRQASYQGHVRLESEGATLQADTFDAYFSGAPGERNARIERVTADGHVVVTEPGRRATGEHAEYVTALGKIVMTGGPPKIYDLNQGFASGQRLTFFVHDDRLLVDGGAKSQAISEYRIVP